MTETGELKGSLASEAKLGAIWSVAGYGGTQVTRLVANIILTRLLFEAAFGLMQLVTVFVIGLHLFSDIGIGPSIIQNKRGADPRFLNTAWTVQAGRGTALWVITCVVSVPFAGFYDQPELVWVMPVAGMTALIEGFNSTKYFTQNRELSMKRLSLIDIASQLAGSATMIAWAFFHRSVWALVVGVVVTALAKTALTHLVLPGVRNRFAWDRDALKELIRFGRWIFFSTLLTFAVGQADRLVFGKMIPIELLGIYGIGATLATMPTAVLQQIISRVAFPVYSRVQNEGGDVPAAYRRVRFPMLILGGWLLSGFIAGGPTMVEVLYDDRWREAGWIVQLLAAGAWLSILDSTNGAALLARGKSIWIAGASLGKLVGMLVLIPLGFLWGEFPGAVAGFACSELLRYAVSAIAVWREGLRGWHQDLGLSLWVYGSSLGAWLIAKWVLGLTGEPVVAAIAVLVVVTLLWLPLGLRSRQAPAAFAATR